MQYIGKLDRNKLGEYKDKIVTEDVIITDERIEHVMKHHSELEYNELKLIKIAIENPNYIFLDRKNSDTVLFVKKIVKNYIVVIKLNTNVNSADKANTIISFWTISNKKLGQYKRNEKTIFKKLDNNE